jgi:hypothetical protein
MGLHHPPRFRQTCGMAIMQVFPEVFPDLRGSTPKEEAVSAKVKFETM